MVQHQFMLELIHFIWIKPEFYIVKKFWNSIFYYFQIPEGRYLFDLKILLWDNFSEGYPVSNER